MTIFRCNLLASLLCVAGCTDQGINAPERESELEFESIEVRRDGKAFDYNAFAAQFDGNPNRFSPDFLESKWTVRGRIEKLGLVDPYREVFGSAASKVNTEYHIPLTYRGLDMTGQPDVRISIWMKDFTRAKAALLEVGQWIEVECQGMRVVGRSALTFDGCREKKQAS